MSKILLINKSSSLKTEIFSGLTVALTLVPEVIAFSIVLGVNPLVGIYSAFIISLITSIIGGRPGMISGAAGAVAVVVVALVAQHGVEYLFAAVVLMGIIQIAIGVLKLGKFIRLVPHPVIFGFLNGLAFIIFQSQLAQFKVVDKISGATHWLSGQPLFIMIGLVLLTIAIIYFLPKLTKFIPSSLAAILLVSFIVIGFNIETKSIGDIASIKGGLPTFHFPSVPFNGETLRIIFPYSLIMALVGLIESLLTLTVIDELTQTRGRGNKECIAQGTANLVCGFFGGMGGCAMIGQSIINIQSGARQRISGIIASIGLLVFVLFASDLIEKVPVAALVGLMIMVSIGTFEWASLKIFGKVPLTDIIVMLLTALITIISHNLAFAVFAGVIISALAFAWENAKRIRARKYIDDKGIKHYEIYGPLFFGSTQTFIEKFDIENDPNEVVIDFKESRVVDHSAIQALNKITEKYARLGKRVHLNNLSKDCEKLLKKASPLIEVNYYEDFGYKVVSDELS